MTSSLVGSEMCIRDRLHMVAEGNCQIIKHALPRHAQFARRQRSWQRQRNCLLYTSDAADDM
eukprot:8444117-Prorocentrum_lima.AAC.1